MSTWIQLNPDWEYWFWTPDDVKQLLIQSYPQYVPLYNSYGHVTFRADVMKYFVLHSFGGFYADLDTECLRPLENWTSNHQCILNYTPFELDYLFHKRKEASVATAIMACRSGHPFFGQVIRSLPAFRRMRNILKATGPFFVDLMYRRYVQTLDKMNHGELSCDFRLEVLNSSYFIPTSDPGQLKNFRKKCSQAGNSSDSFLQKACHNLGLNPQNTPPPQAFANHVWIHMFEKESTWRAKPATSVLDIAPNVTIFSQK